MNAPLDRRRLAPQVDDPQAELPLESDGVRRYRWNSRYGEMLIEVQDGRVYVNGAVVEPAPGHAGPVPGQTPADPR